MDSSSRSRCPTALSCMGSLLFMSNMHGVQEKATLLAQRGWHPPSNVSRHYFATGGGTISCSRWSFHRRLNSSSL